MTKTLATLLSTVALAVGSSGCVSRIIHEGAGAAKGASGKAVASASVPDLTKYASMQVEPITVAPGVQAPPDLPQMVAADLASTAATRGLSAGGPQPALKLSGQIIHYETGGAVDTAIGPLSELMVHATLTDAQSGALLAQGNLVGRSKATTSSGAKNLSAGVGKGLDKWLKEGGLKKAGGEAEQE